MGGGRIVAFLAHPAAAASGAAPGVVKVAYGKGTRFAAAQRVSPAGQSAGDLVAAEAPAGELLTWIREDAPSYVDGTVYAALAKPRTLPTFRDRRRLGRERLCNSHAT